MTLYFATIVVAILFFAFGLWGLKRLENASERRKAALRQNDRTSTENAPTVEIRALTGEYRPAPGERIIEGACDHV
jgi:hypothetical protein